MLEKLKGLSQKYAEIEYMLSQSEVWADAQKAAALSREKAELAPLMEAYARYETFRQEAESAEELLSDPEMKDLARETLSEARSGMERTAEELKILLLPKDPDDGKNVIVEIRGGVGGEESALFAADLFRMYEMYAERKGFSVEIVNGYVTVVATANSSGSPRSGSIEFILQSDGETKATVTLSQPNS